MKQGLVQGGTFQSADIEAWNVFDSRDRSLNSEWTWVGGRVCLWKDYRQSALLRENIAMFDSVVV